MGARLENGQCVVEGAWPGRCLNQALELGSLFGAEWAMAKPLLKPRVSMVDASRGLYQQHSLPTRNEDIAFF